MYWYLNWKGISWESWRRERYLRIFGVRTRVTRLLRDGSGFQVISCRRFMYQSGLQNKPRKIIISPFYNTNFTPKSAGTHSDNMIFAKWSFNLLIKKKQNWWYLLAKHAWLISSKAEGSEAVWLWWGAGGWGRECQLPRAAQEKERLSTKETDIQSQERSYHSENPQRGESDQWVSMTWIHLMVWQMCWLIFVIHNIAGVHCAII